MKCHRHDQGMYNAFRLEHWCYVRKIKKHNADGLNLHAVIYDVCLESMTTAVSATHMYYSLISSVAFYKLKENVSFSCFITLNVQQYLSDTATQV